MGTTYGERLDLALKHAKKSRAELAQRLRNPAGEFGVSASAVAQVLNGKSNSLTAENSALAAAFLGVNHHWLATGVGRMIESSPGPKLVAQEPPAAWHVSDEQVLLHLHRLLRRCPPEMRPALADMLSGLARDGGAEDRTQAICRLLDVSEKRQGSGQSLGR